MCILFDPRDNTDVHLAPKRAFVSLPDCSCTNSNIFLTISRLFACAPGDSGTISHYRYLLRTGTRRTIQGPHKPRTTSSASLGYHPRRHAKKASMTSSNSTSNPASSATESEILVTSFLSENPQLNKDLGDIGIKELDVQMTERFTNKEWAAQIRETVKKVLGQVRDGEKKKVYDAPRAGSKEFAETVDHTLLKLDATSSQIDALCSEARTEGFKVGSIFCSR